MRSRGSDVNSLARRSSSESSLLKSENLLDYFFHDEVLHELHDISPKPHVHIRRRVLVGTPERGMQHIMHHVSGCFFHNSSKDTREYFSHHLWDQGLGPGTTRRHPLVMLGQPGHSNFHAVVFLHLAPFVFPIFLFQRKLDRELQVQAKRRLLCNTTAGGVQRPVDACKVELKGRKLYAECSDVYFSLAHVVLDKCFKIKPCGVFARRAGPNLYLQIVPARSSV